jgi:hypothetical protein
MALIISTQNILGSFRMSMTCFRIGADSDWDVEKLLVPGRIAEKSIAAYDNRLHYLSRSNIDRHDTAFNIQGPSTAVSLFLYNYYAPGTTLFGGGGLCRISVLTEVILLRCYREPVVQGAF